MCFDFALLLGQNKTSEDITINIFHTFLTFYRRNINQKTIGRIVNNKNNCYLQAS